MGLGSVKLATGETSYPIDEPTTGLSFLMRTS
jgi:excinuclease UvrABC ATPase subunit